MRRNIDIEMVLKELYTVSGCRVSIHNSEYTEIAAYPHDLSPFCRVMQTNPAVHMRCLRGDADALSLVRRTEEPYVYRCHLGLFEAVAPLYHAGVLTGYLMMGQVADGSREVREDIFRRAEECFPELFMSRETLWDAVEGILETTEERFTSFVGLMAICAEYVTLSGQMDMPVRDLAHMVKKYIHQNFSQRITLDDLCANFRCSKSTLMNSFRSAYDTTINTYLTEVRLARAQRLLTETDKPVRTIAQECGFTDQGYFTKVFVAEIGFPPTVFRARVREGDPTLVHEVTVEDRL